MSELAHAKVQQACRILEELGLDAWMLWVRETDQMADPALRLVLEGDLVWPSILLLTRQAKRVAVVGRFDADGLAESAFDRIVPYDEDVRPALLALLGELNPQTIAINVSRSDVGADGMTAGMRDWLAELLAGTGYAERLTSAERLVGALRGRKTAQEVDLIADAVRETEEIFDAVFSELASGQTEVEIHRLFHRQIEARGLGFAWNPAHNPAVDAGPEKGFGHVGPTHRRTRRGHLLHFDFGIRKRGYCSDLQRMVFFGKESEIPYEVARGFETVRDAITAAAEALRPGVVGAEVDAMAREWITSAGYGEFKNALGHQIGRNAHDGGTLLGPRWPRYGDLPEGRVECGNVFTLEPNLTTEEYGMISLEEDVVVTETGCQFLSTPQHRPICIPC